MIVDMDVVKLPRYSIIGKYTRFEEHVLNELKDAKQSVISSFTDNSSSRKNYLLWAAPGSGKTFFAQQIAAAQSDICEYHEINLAKFDQDEFDSSLTDLTQRSTPVLCLIDEIDAKLWGKKAHRGTDQGPAPISVPHPDETYLCVG